MIALSQQSQQESEYQIINLHQFNASLIIIIIIAVIAQMISDKIVNLTLCMDVGPRRTNWQIKNTKKENMHETN